MKLLIDTTETALGAEAEKTLKELGKTDFELCAARELRILPCAGCNFCWLKTPGICTLGDDYEQVLKKMHAAEAVWLVTDTRFGFVSYQTKNIIDRVMPLVTMNLKMEGRQMRHVMRYEKNPDFGIIYTGAGDREYLARWCGRVALNFGGRSLGVYPEAELREAAKCM